MGRAVGWQARAPPCAASPLHTQHACRFEWVETELSLPPNKSRCCLFSDGQLTLAQVGHTALRTHLPAPDVAAGRVVWDVVQLVQLKDVRVRSRGAGVVGRGGGRKGYQPTYCAPGLPLNGSHQA